MRNKLNKIMVVVFLIALVGGFAVIGLKDWIKPISKSNVTASSSKSSNTTKPSNRSSSESNSGSTGSDNSSSNNNENNQILTKPDDIPQQLWDDALNAYEVIVAEHDGIKYGKFDPDNVPSPNSNNVSLAWAYKYHSFINGYSVYFQQQFPQLYQNSYYKQIRLINAIYYMGEFEDQYRQDMSELQKNPFSVHKLYNADAYYESYKRIADEILNIPPKENTQATPRENIIRQQAMEQWHNYLHSNLEALTKKLQQISSIKKSDEYTQYPTCHDDDPNWQPKLATGEDWIGANQGDKDQSAEDVTNWFECKVDYTNIDKEDLVPNIDELLQYYPEDRRYKIQLITLALYELERELAATD